MEKILVVIGKNELSIAAVSMLLKGWIYTAQCLGAATFLLAIMPFGIGAGSPSTGIMAASCFILLKKQVNFIWKKTQVLIV